MMNAAPTGCSLQQRKSEKELTTQHPYAYVNHIHMMFVAAVEVAQTIILDTSQTCEGQQREVLIQ